MLLLCTINLQAQWALGDIVFTAYQSDALSNPSGENDQFTFLLLRDVSSGEQIEFTENGWLAAGGFRTGENTVTFTFGLDLPAGTEVSIDASLAAKLADDSSAGTVTGNGLALSTSGDQIFAYDPANTPSVSNQTGFIAAIHMNGAWDADATSTTTSAKPAIFDTLANSAFNIEPEADNGIFNCASGATIKGVPSVLRANIHNSSNWNTTNLNDNGDQPSNCGFEVVFVWNGATDNDWSNSLNWMAGETPTSGYGVLIPSTGVTNFPTINSPASVKFINIASGASLIANASVTGDATYTRNLPTTNWYLVSAPVAGETQEDIIANHAFATGSGSNIGIGAFSNNGTSPWVYATASSTGPLVAGSGVSMKLAAAGDISITGTINSSDINFPIATGTRNNFNLVGNPFTAYVNSATFTSANTSLLSEETVWLWDGTQYVTYNAVSPIQIAPSQGFFVNASGSGNVTFTTSNQSHQASDTFMRQNLDKLELITQSDSNISNTKVFFVDNKTTGFDNGYDSSMFGGTTQNFAVFTELLSNNDGKKLAIQTLPKNDIETRVIPVGIIADAGKQITFSVNNVNLPTGISIYLEDRETGEFYNLSENSTSINIENSLNGAGKFYLHLSANRLSTDDIIKNNNDISIYKSNSNEITISGLQAKGNVLVYSLIGKEVFKTTVNSNGYSKISTPTLPAGVYIVKVTSEKGTKTQKLIFK